ncbi:MAG: toll/interleukin-1 receptor domain-containing protein [Chloroflexota bacterium]
MANKEQIKILKSGVKKWNNWRTENPKTLIDFSGAYFKGAHLEEINLRGAGYIRSSNPPYEGYQARVLLTKADLRYAKLFRADLSREVDLSKANLLGTQLVEVDLRGSFLDGADLSGATLLGADLSFAHLSNTNLTGVNFIGAILTGVDLRYANLLHAAFGNTILAFIDMTSAKGLEETYHDSPSRIAIQTIRGKIPEKFLRGCGLGDWEIELDNLYREELSAKEVDEILYRVHDLRVHQAIQYYSVFISYSTKDQVFVQRLHDNLQESGVRCWFAPEDLKIGDKFRGRIDDAIWIHDKLLIVLSENSINSTWVEKEVETAFGKESKGGGTVLFPICLDDSIMKTEQAWAADIRRARHIGNFSEKDSYQKAFERLLRDLKATEKEEK